jgi:hypothetical protein
MRSDVQTEGRDLRSRRGRSSEDERLAMVRWTAGLGAVTAEAIAYRRQISLVAARARLRRAVAERMLSVSRPLHRRPALYAVTSAGMRACGCRLDGCRVSPSCAQHLIACAALAAGLERSYPTHVLSGERELRLQERERGERIASALLLPGQAGKGLIHRPDLVLWPRAGEACALPLAIEVELTVKAPRRLLAICRAWARCELVGGVLYLAAPEVQAPLRRAIERANAGGRVLVLPLGSVPGPLAQAIPSAA